MYRRSGGPLRGGDVRELRRRAGERKWTLAVGGSPRRDALDEEREHRHEVAAAGADWWVEGMAPDERETMRAAVVRGPLRVD
jgi:hypothetical protein